MTQAVSVDIWNEILDLGSEATHLSIALTRRGDRPADPQETWELTHMRASAIEKIYTGCERVMAQIASSIDGAPVHSEEWHIALLRRLAHPFPGVRDAVLSTTMHGRLDRLRAFRHRERNSYGIDLDPNIVLARAREAVETFERFRDEIREFMLRRNYDPATVEEVD